MSHVSPFTSCVSFDTLLGGALADRDCESRVAERLSCRSGVTLAARDMVKPNSQRAVKRRLHLPFTPSFTPLTHSLTHSHTLSTKDQMDGPLLENRTPRNRICWARLAHGARIGRARCAPRGAVQKSRTSCLCPSPAQVPTPGQTSPIFSFQLSSAAVVFGLACISHHLHTMHAILPSSGERRGS